PEQLSDLPDLNRTLSVGQLATDRHGHLYYAFHYLPEPTVRQYDRNGYAAGQDIQFTNLDAFPEAIAMRREIGPPEKRGRAPAVKAGATRIGCAPGQRRGRGRPANSPTPFRKSRQPPRQLLSAHA